MESVNGLSNLKNFMYTSGSTPDVSHFSFLTVSESYSGSSLVQQTKNLKLSDGAHYHERCSSESFLLEEQPSWLDDLLNDSDTTLYNNGHRRSASDSYTYLGETTEKFTRRDVSISAIETKIDSLNKKIIQEPEEVYTLSVDQNREELSSKNLEDSSNIATGSQVKSYASKTEARRAKQHNAHRSRVRKLQYVDHLERMVQNLQAQGAEIAGELQFLEQKNMILVMENRALRQRLESISQEHIIKQWEQEMLEREIGRIQTMYHTQKQQQQMQLHNQHQSNTKQRRNRSTRDHLDQANCFQMNNKDYSSIKSSATSSVQI